MSYLTSQGYIQLKRQIIFEFCITFILDTYIFYFLGQTWQTFSHVFAVTFL